MAQSPVGDLYAALARALGAVSTGDGWKSAQELTDATGRSKSTVRAWIEREVKAGRIEVGQARRPKVTGITQIVPVYRLKGGKRGKA